MAISYMRHLDGSIIGSDHFVNVAQGRKTVPFTLQGVDFDGPL